MTTIYEATIGRTAVICAMGANRSYAIGDVAYKFRRPKFANGMAQTLPTFARGVPVMYVDGIWRETQTAEPVIREWSTVVTVIEAID